MMNRWILLASLIAAGGTVPAGADSADARCDIYPKGSDRLDATVPCTFSQRQGRITITRKDGISYDLAPVDNGSGNFQDQNGRPVHRESGLGAMGQIFRLPDESVFVYWETSKESPAESAADNPTAPFSTTDYDATAQIRCTAAGNDDFSLCPVGILRMEDGQASVVVQSQDGEQFTINFLTDDVNATNHDVNARLEGDTWIVTLENGAIYEVPLAAIEGG